jgi:hypothetical protein
MKLSFRFPARQAISTKLFLSFSSKKPQKKSSQHLKTHKIHLPWSILKISNIFKSFSKKNHFSPRANKKKTKIYDFYFHFSRIMSRSFPHALANSIALKVTVINLLQLDIYKLPASWKMIMLEIESIIARELTVIFLWISRMINWTLSETCYSIFHLPSWALFW